jgi:hypothetical protein
LFSLAVAVTVALPISITPLLNHQPHSTPLLYSSHTPHSPRYDLCPPLRVIGSRSVKVYTCDTLALPVDVTVSA